jgi:hypothetical protein
MLVKGELRAELNTGELRIELQDSNRPDLCAAKDRPADSVSGRVPRRTTSRPLRNRQSD